MRLVLAVVLAVGFYGAGWANNYTVRNIADAGHGSLRWAIGKANANPGPDGITFRPGLAGRGIRLATELPTITDAGTRINGDIDGDGKPDIQLSGADLTAGAGICVDHANWCTIIGLAVVRFPAGGIVIGASDHCTVRSCHVGVNLLGTRALWNTGSQVTVHQSDSVTVGGTSATDRNVIASGNEGTGGSGVLIQGGTGVTVQGNYVGLRANGTGWLAEGYNGITVQKEAGVGGGHLIGGGAAGAGNFIVGTMFGVRLHDVNDCAVQGNRFGLCADGDTVIKRDYSAAVVVESGAQNNLIGGTSAGARNVIAGHVTGVSISGVGTQANRIFGNYLGLNVAGTKQRYLVYAVSLHDGAGANKVGGASAASGNYICPRNSSMRGVYLNEAGSGTLVRNNKFGIMPSGDLAVLGSCGVWAYNADAELTDNAIGGGNPGIYATGAGGRLEAFRNTFRACHQAAAAGSDARLLLGNLGNASTADDGGNLFQKSNETHIFNNTAWRIRAEGNDFGTTVGAEIEAKIHDKLDDPSLGRVDFDPLAGGVHPSDAAGGALTVASLAAVPTAAGGAQVVFTLSSSATVTARTLNIAGRPVATLCRARDCGAGTNSLVWNAQSDQGVPAPNGMYLVEVVARASDGTEARAVTPVTIRR